MKLKETAIVALILQAALALMQFLTSLLHMRYLYSDFDDVYSTQDPAFIIFDFAVFVLNAFSAYDISRYFHKRYFQFGFCYVINFVYFFRICSAVRRGAPLWLITNIFNELDVLLTVYSWSVGILQFLVTGSSIFAVAMFARKQLTRRKLDSFPLMSISTRKSC